MKTFALRELGREAGGEYVLGLKDLGTHACYMIYGELKPGQTGREACPGKGHEEILLAVKGDLQLSRDGQTEILREGRAMHLRGAESLIMSNPGSQAAIYIMAGGHSTQGHH